MSSPETPAPAPKQKPALSFALYSALRIGIFAVVLAVLLVLDMNPFLAAVIAAVVGFCVSYIFFRRPREAVVESLVELRRSPRHDSDAAAEDDAPAREATDERPDSERERGA